MASGLLALLDDVVALVKLNAANLDDISAQVGKTGSKVSGIVIDDAAVTPKYVVGLDPKRELSIIVAIAKSSLINKLIFLMPIALLLGFFLPWLIQPILMVGGGYLCFEGYEKLHHIFAHNKPETKAEMIEITPDDLEKMRIKSAVRTDFILSAEIIAISYSTVADSTIIEQLSVISLIAVLITIAVYGTVGVIVKMDDFGLYLVQQKSSLSKKIGHSIVRIMPIFLSILSYVGTAAMLWVGAEIIIHGIAPLHHHIEALAQHFPKIAIVAWLFKAGIAAICGIFFGAIIAFAISMSQKIWKK
jgi:predicted DNA repair protein MutK